MKCAFYVGNPPRDEEKEAARSERPILVGCQRVLGNGKLCGGSWDEHYGYSRERVARTGGSQGASVEVPKPTKRNARLAALQAQYKEAMNGK